MLDVKNTKVVILAGGKGTRLGSLTKDMPKPLLPVNKKPFLDYIINNFSRYGFRDFIILAGYYGDRIKTYYKNYSNKNLNIRVIIEEEPLGTAGCLLLSEDYLSDYFLVTNGDSILDFNYLSLWDNLDESSFICKIALRYVKDSQRYGQVILHKNSSFIKEFSEKSLEKNSAGLVNGGVYLLNKKILSYIEKKQCSIEQDIFPKLVKNNKILGAKFEGFFIDIGIPSTYKSVQNEINLFLYKPAVLFDRDNTLNRDHGYTFKIADLEWLKGAMEFIRKCNDIGKYVFVVTNQAGVAKGKYKETDVQKFHDEMQLQLNQIGAHVDEFVYCPHHPDGVISKYKKKCNCRKPESGMLEYLKNKWYVDWEKSFLIGDKQSDIQAAEKFGIRGLLFENSFDLRELIK